MDGQPIRELKQKYMNETREFYLEPNRLKLVVKDLDGEIEKHIEYEIISNETRTITRQNGTVYIAAVSFGIFGLVGVFLNFFGIDSLMRWAPLWLIASVILWGFHFYKRRRYFLIDMHNKQSIFFVANRPSKDALARFVKDLYATRKDYLRKAYFGINPTNTIDAELKKFQWLYKENIITELEFQKAKAALVSVSDPAISQTKEITIH